VAGRRHSISGNCHRPNFEGSSPNCSTQNAESEKPLSSPTFDHIGLNHSASQKRRSKALSFGDLSKRVFDVSCSNESQTTNCLPRLDGNATAIEKSFETTGKRSRYGAAESNEVPELHPRPASSGHDVPATHSTECKTSESPQDDNSKTPENATCLGMSSSCNAHVLPMHQIGTKNEPKP
jgi:hypothetical protein